MCLHDVSTSFYFLSLLLRDFCWVYSLSFSSEPRYPLLAMAGPCIWATFHQLHPGLQQPAGQTPTATPASLKGTFALQLPYSHFLLTMSTSKECPCFAPGKASIPEVSQQHSDWIPDLILSLIFHLQIVLCLHQRRRIEASHSDLNLILCCLCEPAGLRRQGHTVPCDVIII